MCQKTEKELWTLITANQTYQMLQDNEFTNVVQCRLECVKAPEFPPIPLSNSI